MRRKGTHIALHGVHGLYVTARHGPACPRALLPRVGGGAPHGELVRVRALVPRALVHQLAIRAGVLRGVQLDAQAPHVRREWLWRWAPPRVRRRLGRGTVGPHQP